MSSSAADVVPAPATAVLTASETLRLTPVSGLTPSGGPLNFASQGQTVIEVPFDGHLRPGGVIDHTNEMSATTRRRFVEIAAALADHFPTRDDRSRERY